MRVALLALALLAGAGVAPAFAAVPLRAADELEDRAREGRWDDVIVLASERLEADPGDVPAAYWLGRAWLARAESLLAGSDSVFARDLARSSLDRAVQRLAQVSAAVPAELPAAVPAEDFADAADWKAYARFLRGDEDLAAELEQRFEQTGDAYSAFLRGRSAERAGEADAAEWFRRASEQQPERSDFALAWSDALAAGGDLSGARAAWRRARDAGATPGELLPRLLALLPQPEQAGARLEELDALVAERDLGADGFTAWYRSHALLQSGEPQAAEAVLAAATHGRTLEVDRAHADLLLQLGRPDEAAELLARCVRDGEHGALAALLEVADAAALDGAWEPALKAYETVLAEDPDHERALRNRALTTWRSGQREAALESWRELARRWPERADVLNDAALFLWVGGESGHARQLWEQALGLEGDADALENLAVSLVASEPERAQALLEELLATDPARDRALYHVHRARQAGLR